jgi:hypothetical protein
VFLFKIPVQVGNLAGEDVLIQMSYWGSSPRQGMAGAG